MHLTRLRIKLGKYQKLSLTSIRFLILKWTKGYYLQNFYYTLAQYIIFTIFRAEKSESEMSG